MNQEVTEWLTPTEGGDYKHEKLGASGNTYHEERIPASKELQRVLEEASEAQHEDGSYIISDVDSRVDEDIYQVLRRAVDDED